MMKKRRHGLVTIASPSPFNRSAKRAFLGGAERYLYELCKLIRSMGYEVEVFQPAENSFLSFFHGIPVFGLPTSESAADFSREFHLRVSASELTIYFAPFLAEHFAFSPSIGISHGVYWDDPVLQTWDRSYQVTVDRLLRAVRNLTTLVSVDANTINCLRSMDWNVAQKCIRIPNFVDTSRFAPRPKVQDTTRPAVLFPRRLAKARGLDLLYPVIKSVVKDAPEALFFLVGQPEDEEAKVTAEKLAAEFPTNVRIAEVPMEDMAEAYDLADIVIIPSTSAEGTSLACLEALAAGKAVIATPVGGLPELIVDGVTGLLVDPFPEPIARAVLQLIRNPELKRGLSRNARQASLAFSLESWRQRWLELLSSFLQSPLEDIPRHFVFIKNPGEAAHPGMGLFRMAVWRELANRGMRVAIEKGRDFSCVPPNRFVVPDGFSLFFPQSGQLLPEPPEGSGSEPPWWSIALAEVKNGVLEVLLFPNQERLRTEPPVLPAWTDETPPFPIDNLRDGVFLAGILGDFRRGLWQELFCSLPKSTEIRWLLVGPGAEAIAPALGELTGSSAVPLPDLTEEETVGFLRGCDSVIVPAFSKDDEFWAEEAAATAISFGTPTVLNFRPNLLSSPLCFIALNLSDLEPAVRSALAVSLASERERATAVQPPAETGKHFFDTLQTSLQRCAPSITGEFSAPLSTVSLDTELTWQQAALPSRFSVQDVVRLSLSYASYAQEHLFDLLNQLEKQQQNITELQFRYQALVDQYGKRQQEVERLCRLLETKEADWGSKYQALVGQYGERQQEIERLVVENQQLRTQVAEWTTKHQALVKEYDNRQREVERLSRLLTGITSTRWFRLASFYWRLRSRLAGTKQNRSDNDTILTPPESEQPSKAEEPPLALRENPSSQRAPVLWTCDYRFDVLCLPIIDWDFRFQRPQQLAVQWARHGHRVFYVTQKFRSFGKRVGLEQKGQNIWEVSLKGPKRNVYQDAMDPEALEAYFEACDYLRREHQLGATAVIVQLPFWWPLAQRLRERFGWPVIYDCMDYHAGFSTNRPDMLQLEDDLLAGADLVLASSQLLLEHCGKHNPRVLHLPNACDFEHFARVPFRIPAQTPVVGYYGAIADWFDSDLVADLAELRPNWRFLLVGSTFTADTKRLARLPNVELVGEKPYPQIPQWVEQMDCLIIPFKRTPLTDATNPVKFFEIMAAGKPLVSVPLPELLPFGDYVRFAETADGFVREITCALDEETEESSARRRAFAQNHTWEKRFETLHPAVVSAFPKASIVVVTHNNLHLTKQCLESIFARTEWPNYELFVVDNASSDGTPEYLRELGREDPRVRVILNAENRGFAAANNQALREAQGEFIVLLNNDTVVTRGWLSGLIRHLRSHPDFGLVGPVSNWIGNEAQVQVGYCSLEDMPLWAQNYVKDHDGEFFDIPVAALFCAAMRRETFTLVGELDERFGLGMFEDDDYAIRVRDVGLRVVCVEDVFVHHHGKASFKNMPPAQYQELFEKNRALFEAKWGKAWTPHRYRWQQ